MHKKLAGIAWNSGRLDYSELSSILPRAEKGEYFKRGTEKCTFLGNSLHKEVENLEDSGSPKVQEIVDEKIGIFPSYPFRHKTTLHCAERKTKLFGIWITWHLK